MSDTSYQVEIRQASKAGYSTPAESNATYKVKYSRSNYITHWWGAPGQVGNHDQTVDYILGQAAAGKMSVNYVVSDEKITMTVPPDDVSWGSGSLGNPTGVNVEHQPTLGAEGYKKAGWLKHQLEQRWGHQLAIRKHSDFMQTACPGTIDLGRIEAECQRWRDGFYDQPVVAAPAPTPVPEPAPTPSPSPEAFRREFIEEKTVRIKKSPAAQLWDLNRRSWADMTEHPVGAAGYGTQFKTSTVAYQALGGKYYMPNPNAPEGYNVDDCEDVPVEAAPAAPAAPAVPDAPKPFTQNTVDGIVYDALDGNPRQMWIVKRGGTEKWSLSGVKSWRDFKSVEHKDYGAEVFITGVAHHPIPPNGADFFVTGDDMGDFRRTGHPANAYGFNRADLSATKPGPEPPTPAAPITDVVTAPTPAIPAAPAEPSSPNDWKTTYRAFVNAQGDKTPVMYIALENYTVKPLDGSGPEVALHLTDYILLGGTFKGPDGKIYGRPEDAATRFLWHGVPMDEGVIETKAKVFNSNTTPAERKVLGTTTLNDRLVFLADDLQKITAILEKVWGLLPFKNKNNTKINK